MIDSELYDIAEETLTRLRALSLMIATAESCTGGMIGAALTAVPGSSDVVDRGFITYTNSAKVEMLGVDAALLGPGGPGAVSKPVAQQMAEGALSRCQAQIAIAVTGVAGPGASERKPAGLVFIGCAIRDKQTIIEEHHFPGDRAAVRRATVLAALALAVRQAC